MKLFNHLKIKPFKLKANNTNQTHFNGRSLNDWTSLFNWIIRKNKSPFVLQDTSTVLKKENSSVTESIDFLTSNLKNSVGLLNYEVSPPTICLKIDNPYLVKRIIQVFKGNFAPYVKFNTLFDNPIMITNFSTSFLLLIYRRPSFLYQKDTIFKNNTTIRFQKTCRFGFKIDYIFGLSPLVTSDSLILNDPGGIIGLDLLPRMLWPWNPDKAIIINENYDSNLNSNRREGFTIKDNQKLIASGKNKNLGFGKGKAKIGRYPTLFDFCNIENYTLDEVRTMYILTCEDDEPTRKSMDTLAMFKQKNLAKSTANPSSAKNNYFNWFCQYGADGVNHARSLASIGVIQTSISKSKTFKIIDLKQQILKETNYFENQENVSKYTMISYKNIVNSQFFYRTPVGVVYPHYTYQELLDKKIIPDVYVCDRLHTLNFHPFRAFVAAHNYNTSFNVILLVAWLEDRENLSNHQNDWFIDDQIWLGQGIETILIWLLEKNNALNIICVEQKNWFIKDGSVWKNIDENQVLNHLYFQLYDLQIGNFAESLKDASFLRALIKKVNCSFWPFKLNSFN